MSSIEVKIEKIIKGQEEIRDDINVLRTAIVGNDLGTTGIVTRIEGVEKYQNKDKKQKWLAVGFVTAFGTILKFWDQIVKSCIH